MSISKLLGATMIAGAPSEGAASADKPTPHAGERTSSGTHADASAPTSRPTSLMLARMRHESRPWANRPQTPARENVDVQPRTEDVRAAA